MDMIRQAEVAYREGRLDEAIDRYESFVDTFPDSDLIPSALVSLGQIREKQDQKVQAIDAYQQLVDQHPDSRFTDEARRRLSYLYINAGLYDQAAQFIVDMLGRPNRIDEESRLRILLAKAYLGQGNRGGALDLLVRAQEETPDANDKDQARRGVKAAILGMSPEELSHTQTLFSREYPGDFVTYVLAYRLYELGRMDEARSQAEFFLENHPSHPLVPDARALLLAIDGQAPAPPLETVQDFQTAPSLDTSLPEVSAPVEGPIPDYESMDVACILPLSDGAASKYGLKVKTGLDLAFKIYQPKTPGFRSQLIVIDSKGDPVLARQAVDQAAAQNNVLAAVGPLVSKAAFEAAPRAEQLKFPILTITQKSGIPQIGPHIFRLFLTPEAQARAVARYAVQVLGLGSFAIMHPDDAYGKTMSDYFQQEISSLGANVVGVQSYDPKATDFSAQIRQLSGVGKAARQVSSSRQVQVSFEAVFLPDSYRAVAMISPQFAYHDITGIRLLGTSLWHTDRLLSTAARYTQRSVIPTAFYARSDRAEVQQFLQAYRLEKGDPAAEPDEFVAYGYDAGMLLLTLMDQYHVSTREALTEALSNLRPFPGATGTFTFNADGEYQIEPTLLTVEGSEFQQIK
jgi:ABC-type branched-subunit amino acid transport system substrate-binding protein/TolA-binding protein